MFSISAAASTVACAVPFRHDDWADGVAVNFFKLVYERPHENTCAMMTERRIKDMATAERNIMNSICHKCGECAESGESSDVPNTVGRAAGFTFAVASIRVDRRNDLQRT